MTPEGKIKDSSQTGYALAFTMGLLPDEPKIQKLASDAFVEEIKRKEAGISPRASLARRDCFQA